MLIFLFYVVVALQTSEMSGRWWGRRPTSPRITTNTHARRSLAATAPSARVGTHAIRSSAASVTALPMVSAGAHTTATPPLLLWSSHMRRSIEGLDADTDKFCAMSTACSSINYMTCCCKQLVLIIVIFLVSYNKRYLVIFYSFGSARY